MAPSQKPKTPLRNDRTEYQHFWSDVGANFPDLGGAKSTAYYRENEILLFEENLPDLNGKRVFKTDLWDEAKNTRILQWVAAQGASTYGIDLSTPTADQARSNFVKQSLDLSAATADVRAIPIRDASFDAIYSMGTVEHFDETDQALAEIFRVLKPGGTCIIGVPNRLDPFLRPLMVAAMSRLGLYDYGFEKSYTPRKFRGMLEHAGFVIEATTGILFMPGWLRILDLVAHSWARPLAQLTGLAVKPFAWLYERFPGLRRHGYLMVMIARRPD